MLTNDMIARYLRRLINQPLELRLYVTTSDVAQDPDPDKLIEMSGGGYRSISLKGSDWGIEQVGASVKTPNQRAVTPVASTDAKIFTFNGTKNAFIGGGYLTDADGGLYMLEPFPNKKPLLIGRPGDTIPVRPIVRLSGLG